MPLCLMLLCLRALCLSRRGTFGTRLSICGTGALGKPPGSPQARLKAGETGNNRSAARRRAAFGGVLRNSISGCRLANGCDQFGGAVREQFLSHLRTQRGCGLQGERPFSLGQQSLATIEVLKQVAAGKIKITPEILVQGGESGGNNVLSAFIASLMLAGNKPIAPNPPGKS